MICNVNWDEDNNTFNTNIYCAKFSTKKNRFGICSSNVNTFKTYDLIGDNKKDSNFLSQNVLSTGLFDRPLYSMDFSHNGKNAAFAGADNFIGIIDLNN